MIIEIERHTQINDVLCKIDAQATERINSGSKLTIEIHDNKYTKKQRGSLHVWCEMVAETFNDAGFIFATRTKFNGQEIDINWNMDLVKSEVYKPLLKVMTGKKSTEDQSTIDPSSVALELSRHFAEKYGVTLPSWPSNR